MIKNRHQEAWPSSVDELQDWRCLNFEEFSELFCFQKGSWHADCPLELPQASFERRDAPHWNHAGSAFFVWKNCLGWWMIQLLREILKLKLGPCCCDSVGICFRCFASVKFVGQEQDAQHEQWRQDRMERQRQVGNLVRQPSWSVFCAVSHDEAAFDQVVLCIVTQIYYISTYSIHSIYGISFPESIWSSKNMALGCLVACRRLMKNRAFVFDHKPHP